MTPQTQSLYLVVLNQAIADLGEQGWWQEMNQKLGVTPIGTLEAIKNHIANHEVDEH